MPLSINEHGDRFLPTDGGYGIDVASQRRDQLDDECLEYVFARTKAGLETTAVDLGGGYGAQSMRMAQAGAAVTMIDIADMATPHFAQAIVEQNIPPQRLSYLRKDFALLSENDVPAAFSVLYSQRAIHYVPYRTVQALMRMLFNRMAPGGRAYISAAGYDTEYGTTHPARRKPVEERFDHVTPEMRAKHGIERKITIYTMEDLRVLLRYAGFEDIRIRTSRFGNIKAVAGKRS